jgi:hypothetical protein
MKHHDHSRIACAQRRPQGRLGATSAFRPVSFFARMLRQCHHTDWHERRISPYWMRAQRAPGLHSKPGPSRPPPTQRVRSRGPLPHARGDSTSSCGALHHQSVSMRFGGPSVRAFVVFPVPENESGKYSHAHERGVVHMHEGNHTQSGVRMACAGEGVLQGSDCIAQGSSGC